MPFVFFMVDEFSDFVDFVGGANECFENDEALVFYLFLATLYY